MPHTEGTPYLRFLAGGHLRKAPGNIAESAVLPYSLFPCGGKVSRYSPRVPTTHGSPDPSCGKRGEKSRPRTNKTRGQRGGSETLTYVCYDRNLWELNEKKDASRLIEAVIGFVLFVALVVVGVPLGINAWVCASTRPAFESQAQAAANADAFEADAIVVLGAGINWDGSPSAVLKDRLDVADNLYNAGVAPKIIMSGDNSDSSYNEVMAMAKYAKANGIPAEDIFCDHAGLSTYDSMYRLKNVFNVQRCVIVTQEYHLYRAVYDARGFGIDARGVASDLSDYSNKDSYEQREFFARIKDFLGIITKMEPQTKSEPVSLNQSGTVTQWW